MKPTLQLRVDAEQWRAHPGTVGVGYGSATIKAEPIAANRTPDITVVDVRTEKTFRLKAVRIMGFVDVYNMFNTNAVEALTTTPGGSWLRPTAITAPRVVRIGTRLQAIEQLERRLFPSLPESQEGDNSDAVAGTLTVGAAGGETGREGPV